MSKISLTPNASGTGTLSIASPSTNSDYTLTLPAETGNVVVTDGTTLVVDNATDKVGVGTALGLIAPLTVQAQTQSTSTPLVYLRQGGSSPSYGYVFKIDNSSTGNLFLRRVGAGDTEGSDLVTVTPDGNLLVGTTGLTSNGTRLTLSGSERVARIYGTTEGTAPVTIDKSSATTTTSQVFIQFSVNNQASGCGQINANGASQAAFGSFSDQRLKENIVDLPPQLNNICALRPVEFDYIQSEGGGHQIGFVAQEMQEIYPDVIGVRQPDEMLTVTGWSKTEARLVKAIQELKAENDTLKSRLDAVEALEARIAALEAA